MLPRQQTQTGHRAGLPLQSPPGAHSGPQPFSFQLRREGPSESPREAGQTPRLGRGWGEGQGAGLCVGTRRDLGGGLETWAPLRVRRTPGRGNGNPPTPVFVPGQSHGQRSLAGYSPWDHTESDTTERRNTRNRWINVKMNQARADRVRKGDWGAQRNAAWANPDGFPEVVTLNLALNDKQRPAGSRQALPGRGPARAKTRDSIHQAREGPRGGTGLKDAHGGSPDGSAVRRQGTVSCQPQRSWGAPTRASSVHPAPSKHSSLWKGTSSPLKC